MDSLIFPQDDFYDLSYKLFLENELGLIHQAIPWDKLAKLFDHPMSKCKSGRKPIFSVQGGLALMFLKHYLQLSDKKLISRINSDWQLQYFCGVKIRIHQPVRDDDIVGRWRRFFGIHMDIDKMQDELAKAWSPYLKNTHVLMDDATCYESYIKYPTDVNLLWDCSEYLFNNIDKICKTYGIKKTRTKYKNQKQRQNNYARLRRKPKVRTRNRLRQLLYWVDRGLHILQLLLDEHPEVHGQKGINDIYKNIKVIGAIYGQQYNKFTIPEYKIKHRIVSLYKPYIRPIVRGKVTRPTEFGAKVHMSQVDGINFIEHLSFEAFHEGVRMWKSVLKHKKRFQQCRQYGADQIYATNKNRKFATKRGIATCFKKKGKASKIEDQKSKMRQVLGRSRATILEGSFGNEKNHYELRKIKARTKETEIAWIFFGIHTANAVKISRRIHQTIQEEKLKQAS